MNVETLVPLPTTKWPFRQSHQKFAPQRSGCYVLSTFSNVILYIGLATNLRRRIGEHLDNPTKTAETRIGRPIWFHFLETAEINKVERTWMNLHIQHEGCLPRLNRIYSPTST